MRAFGTLFFTFLDTGWSETYAMNVSDYPGGVTVLTDLATKRLAMMVNDVNLVGTRLSDSDVKGDSFPTLISVPTPGTFAVTPADNTYNINLANRVEFIGNLTQRGQRWIRALPKSQINASGEFAPTGPWTTARSNWVTAVTAGCAAAHKIPGAVAPPFYTFTNYTGFAETGFFVQRKIGRPFGLPRGRRLVA